MKAIVFFLTAALCALASGFPTECPSGSGGERKVWNGSRIVGGHETAPHEFPWQVSLQYGRSHHCGGSILNREWVITAAHCFHEKSKKSFKVLAGSHDHSEDEKTRQWRSIKKVITHPEFDVEVGDYDVALLKLSEPLSFKRRDIVGPITLPEHGKDFVGQRCIASGWGLTSSGQPSDVLRSVELPVWKQKDCVKAYADTGPFTRRMMCAGFEGGGKGTCFGDSGGPLACKDRDGNWTLAGITSWGLAECAPPYRPSVFAAVSSVTDWIEDTMSSGA